MRRLREHFSNTPRPVYIDTMDKVNENYSNTLESTKSKMSRITNVNLKSKKGPILVKNTNFSPTMVNFGLEGTYLAPNITKIDGILAKLTLNDESRSPEFWLIMHCQIP